MHLGNIDPPVSTSMHAGCQIIMKAHSLAIAAVDSE